MAYRRSVDTWLPADFEHPVRFELETGHHLRPIRGDDVDIDYPAVMGSQQRLWDRYGTAWGWPLPTMTPAEDRADLERHEREIAAHESFNYAILDDDDQHLFGCVYIDPPEDSESGVDGLVSWWVLDSEADGPLEACLDGSVRRWVTEAWPFLNPHFDAP